MRTNPLIGLVLFGCLLLSISIPRTAAAYAWIIRDGFNQCAQCHADPSGAGLVTNFGRAEAESVLRTRYVAELDDDDVEPSKIKNFLFGALNLPQELLLGGNFRGGLYHDEHRTKLFESRADVQAQVKVGQVRLNASVGYMYDDAVLARITDEANNNLVSRNYWLGLDFGVEEQMLLRVGRIPLPYGLRTVENRFWVHEMARNDTNDQQQFGVAFSYTRGPWRTDVLGYGGNIQLTPVEKWERGFSGYGEYALSKDLTVGISALAAQSNDDVVLGTALFRANYGVFARWAALSSWVLMSEWDGGLHKVHGAPAQHGFAGLLQSDLLLYAGVHLLVSGELKQFPGDRQGPHGRARVGIDWFCLPHTDMRIDGIYGDVAALLVQAHVYL